MRRFLRKLKTASSFSSPQWKALFQAYSLFLKFRFLLRVLPARTVAKSIFPVGASSPRHSPSTDLNKKQLREAFRISWRYQVGKPRCLVTALAWRALLSLYGEPLTVHIGIKKEGNQLRAHAWCEEEGNSDLQLNYHPLHPLRDSAS